MSTKFWLELTRCIVSGGMRKKPSLKQSSLPLLPNLKPIGPFQLLALLKCNVDATFFEDRRAFGMVFCLCDDNGSFVQACTQTENFLLFVAEGEAIAVLEAIKWLLNLGVENVIVESNCIQVSNNILKGANDLFEFGCTICLCCWNLLHFRSDIKVNFVRRGANSVAHGLVRSFVNFANPRFFLSVPSCILYQYPVIK